MPHHVHRVNEPSRWDVLHKDAVAIGAVMFELFLCLWTAWIHLITVFLHITYAIDRSPFLLVPASAIAVSLVVYPDIVRFSIMCMTGLTQGDFT